MSDAEDQVPIIFEESRDPGEGFLRVVGDKVKIDKNAADPSREISLRDIHGIVFGKGCSWFLSECVKEVTKDGIKMNGQRFKIIGLTQKGYPAIVIITPRDAAGVAKRIVTAWRVSRSSSEAKLLIEKCPDLKERIAKN